MPPLISLLEGQAQALLARWVDRFQAGAEGAFAEADAAWRDRIAGALDELRAALRQGHAPPRNAPVEERGRRRCPADVDVDALLRAYRVLGDVVLEVAEEQSRLLTPAEARIFNDFFANAVAEGAAERERRRARVDVLFQSLVDASDDYIAVADVAGRVVYMNPAALRLSGFARLEDALAFPMIDLVAPESKALMTGEVSSVTLAGHSWGGDFLSQNRATGEVIPFEARTITIKDDRGQVELLGTINRDLRSRRRAEAERQALLQAAEAQWRQLTDALPLLVSFVTADERYHLINRAYQDWFGQPPEQLVGRTLREVIGEAAYEVLSPYVRRALAGEHFSFEQYDVPYRLGGQRDVKVTFVPQRDPGGVVTGYVALLEDISAQRRLEGERERLANQRTEMLAFEQQLIGIVSHDLRSPLKVIQISGSLLAELGEDEGFSPQAARVVARIRAATERASRLVGDLLDFTQARLGGGLAVEPRPADVHAIVAGVVDEIGAAFDGRAIELSREGDGRGEWDPDRIGQAVQNLVTNALKYSPADGTVWVATRAEGADEVSLRVHNGGAPIPADKMRVLFEPFQRAVGHVDKVSRSVGLGLYIVKQVATAHGGDVTVTSNEAEGTTFELRLPRLAARRAPRTP
jgi:phosphoserine phosphatase RsbU/P